MNEELRHLIEKYKRAPDSRLFAPLADAYRKNGEVDMAIEILEKGIERIPDYASAHVILGKCYNDKGATELARAAFGRVALVKSDTDMPCIVTQSFVAAARASTNDLAAHIYQVALRADQLEDRLFGGDAG